MSENQEGDDDVKDNFYVCRICRGCLYCLFLFVRVFVCGFGLVC